MSVSRSMAVKEKQRMTGWLLEEVIESKESCVCRRFCLFSTEILENFVRELEREVKDTDDRENN